MTDSPLKTGGLLDCQKPPPSQGRLPLLGGDVGKADRGGGLLLKGAVSRRLTEDCISPQAKCMK